MTKNTKQDMADKLKSKSFLSMQRQAIQPVDMLETELPNRSTEPNERTVETNGKDERPKRTRKPRQRTVFAELQEGTENENKRAAERYSFEIYTDQKESIDEVQSLYKKKTGKKLSASRIIREALEEYLERALKALRE